MYRPARHAARAEDSVCGAISALVAVAGETASRLRAQLRAAYMRLCAAQRRSAALLSAHQFILTKIAAKIDIDLAAAPGENIGAPRSHRAVADSISRGKQICASFMIAGDRRFTPMSRWPPDERCWWCRMTANHLFRSPRYLHGDADITLCSR